MGFMTAVWTAACSTFAWLTLNPESLPDHFRGPHQVPLRFPQVPTHGIDSMFSSIVTTNTNGDLPPYQFVPPGADPESDFKCDYSNMPGWSYCGSESPGCWLKHSNGSQFNITTDYEIYKPTGILRSYTLDVSNGTINADGQNFTEAKLFNDMFPGPWLQACWGDTVEVIVTNFLPYNGTSIHWHGIRQWRKMHMDGVNGITQCPIRPNDLFVYRFDAMQYGSSWYHSHFSIQYADGLQGPMVRKLHADGYTPDKTLTAVHQTIHGPSSAYYDEAASLPLLMTDWDHVSAFGTLHGVNESNPSILLNGRGNITRYSNATNSTEIPSPYTLIFTPPVPGRVRRYLLRLINTSFETSFVFSIDNHTLQVISADFVPIEPYSTTSVLVGIGQRYNIIVEASPVPDIDGHRVLNRASDMNFWIRTRIACERSFPKGKYYMQTGILRYDPSSDAEPTTTGWKITPRCRDEPYNSLVPIVPRVVGMPANGGLLSGENFTIESPLNKTYNLSNFALASETRSQGLQIDYSDPLFLHLADSDIGNKNPQWIVIPENYTESDWVWLIIQGGQGVHPIHLHGHDFAILQVDHRNFSREILNPHLNNPPRRDVVLVPSPGFVVIAFKADNPGSWLVHCHIARHAAEGLAMQILERQADADKIWPKGSPEVREAQRVCDNWHQWVNDTSNYWNPSDPVYQDDSGI